MTTTSTSVMTTAALGISPAPSPSLAAAAAEPLACMVRALRPAVLLRAVATSLLSAVCYPLLILTLAWHSMGFKEMGWATSLPALAGLCLSYALLGLLIGFVIPLLSALLKQVPEFEQSLRPITERIVSRIFEAFGEGGETSYELGEFRRKLDGIVGPFLFEGPSGPGRLLGRVARRFVFTRAVRAFRDALLHDVVQALEERGRGGPEQHRVTAELLRTYASKQLAAMTAEKLQSRLEGLRTIHLDVTLLLFAVPLGIAIYRLA